MICLKLERSATTTQAKHMATGSEDATVRIWDIHTAKCLQVLKDKRPGQLPSPVMAVDLSPKTDRVVSGTRFAPPDKLIAVQCLLPDVFVCWRGTTHG